MKNKLGIVVALIFVMSFGSLVFAHNMNSSTTTARTITTTRTGSRGVRRRVRRRIRRRHSSRRRARRGKHSGNSNMGNGNTRR